MYVRLNKARYYNTLGHFDTRMSTALSLGSNYSKTTRMKYNEI